MKKLVLLSFLGMLLFFLSSCVSYEIHRAKLNAGRDDYAFGNKDEKLKEDTLENNEKKTENQSILHTILSQAETYKGVPYKYGGDSKKGMDCSALVVNSFKAAEIDLPRTTKEQYSQGQKVSLKKVKEGDLLFFSTKGNIINHVGIVYHVSGENISFIHASSSKGVVISSLTESYWNKTFKKAKRIIL